jgi:hypothetical protein
MIQKLSYDLSSVISAISQTPISRNPEAMTENEQLMFCGHDNGQNCSSATKYETTVRAVPTTSRGKQNLLYQNKFATS